MRSFLDAKAMAKTLRQELHNRKIELGHSECLEVVARQLGFRDWNTMAADMHQQIPDNVGPIPKGWLFGGVRKEQFIAGTVIDPENSRRKLLFVASKPGIERPPYGTYGSIMQVCRADPYRGKRIAFSADLKADIVSGIATIWGRVDNELNMAVAFDNLERFSDENGAIMKSTDWVRRKVVLNVPESAAYIHFGFYTSGHSKAWARNLNFGLTDDLTTSISQDQINFEPQNLDLHLA
jgi:hypothetical protein